MTPKEFKKKLVLRYLGSFIDSLEDVCDYINYDEGGAMELNSDGKMVVDDAFDLAECMVDYINMKDANFFD